MSSGCRRSETTANSRVGGHGPEDDPTQQAGWNLFGKVPRRTRYSPAQNLDVAEVEANLNAPTRQGQGHAALNPAHRSQAASEDRSFARENGHHNQGLSFDGLPAKSSERQASTGAARQRCSRPSQTATQSPVIDRRLVPENRVGSSELPFRPADSDGVRGVLEHRETPIRSMSATERSNTNVNPIPRFGSAGSAFQPYRTAQPPRTGLSQSMAHLAVRGSSPSQNTLGDSRAVSDEHSKHGLGTLAAAAVALQSQETSSSDSQGANATQMPNILSEGRPTTRPSPKVRRRNRDQNYQLHPESIKRRALRRMGAGESGPSVASDMDLKLSTLYAWRKRSDVDSTLELEESLSSSDSEDEEAPQNLGRQSSEGRATARSLASARKAAQPDPGQRSRQYHGSIVKTEALRRLAADEAATVVASEMNLSLSTLYAWRRKEEWYADRQAWNAGRRRLHEMPGADVNARRRAATAEEPAVGGPSGSDTVGGGKKSGQWPKKDWPDLKRQAMQMIAEGGKEVDVARELGTSNSTIYKWVAAAKLDQGRTQ